tara:strand:- start:957 stop:1298 length:342 start_codon:yes stop_codon:yes gene_type:complete
MPTRLTIPQQRMLIKTISPARKRAIKTHCNKCSMKGQGFKEILKSIGSVLGPIAKEIGPIVLKELILPFVKKKISGKGLTPAGGSLKLAGQGKLVKGSLEAKQHMARLRAMRK